MSPLRRAYSPRFRIRPRPRKVLRWRAFSVGTGPLPSDSSTRLVAISRTMMANLGTPTILRIRGEVVATIQFPPTGNVQALATIGIGLQNADDVTDYEDPFGQSYTSDWMWWQPLYLAAPPGAATPQEDARGGVLSAARYVLDVKSRRRFDETDELVVVVTNTGTSLPGTLGAIISGRVLLSGA